MFGGNAQDVPRRNDVPSGRSNSVTVTSSTFAGTGRGSRAPVNDRGVFSAGQKPRVGTENMAEQDKANVHYTMGVLSSPAEQFVGEHAFRFTLDGADAVHRLAQRGAVNSYTLGGLNCLLEEHARREQEHMAALLSPHGAAQADTSAFDGNTNYIVTPEKFSMRVSYCGKQIPAQQFNEPNWAIARRAGSVTVPMKLAGVDTCVNLWGNIREGDNVGFLVRARPRAQDLGTRHAYLNRAPLEVTPVIADGNRSVKLFDRLGMPLVNRSESNGDGSNKRKRLRSSMADQLEDSVLTNSCDGTAEKLQLYRSIVERERNYKLACAGTDSELLNRITATGSVYGMDARDGECPLRVNPRGQCAAYWDTEYDKTVSFAGVTGARHSFKLVQRVGKYIHVGTVRMAPSTAYPPMDMIEKGVFDDEHNRGFDTMRSNFFLDMYYSP